ncbi:MAG: class I SAM-dependent methyltransferase [Planctomycetota bacterium]
MCAPTLEGIAKDLLGGAGSVLDVSCGWGDWARFLGRWGCDAVGVDPSCRRIAWNRGVAARNGTEVRFAIGSPHALPAPDASLDAVVARHLVSRLAHPHRALAEWLRVLRPGGRLLLLDSFPADRRRGGFLQRLGRTARERLLLPPPHPPHRAAPFRAGLRGEEMQTFLHLAEVWDLHIHALPASPSYLVSGRKA